VPPCYRCNKNSQQHVQTGLCLRAAQERMTIMNRTNGTNHTYRLEERETHHRYDTIKKAWITWSNIPKDIEKMKRAGWTVVYAVSSSLTAASENIDSKTLQGMAGHADHQITMNTYVHTKDKNLAKAGQMMDALLGNYAKAG